MLTMSLSEADGLLFPAGVVVEVVVGWVGGGGGGVVVGVCVRLRRLWITSAILSRPIACSSSLVKLT